MNIDELNLGLSGEEEYLAKEQLKREEAQETVDRWIAEEIKKAMKKAEIREVIL